MIRAYILPVFMLAKIYHMIFMEAGVHKMLWKTRLAVVSMPRCQGSHQCTA